MTEPIGLSISLLHKLCRKSNAPGPSTSSLEKDVSSNSPATSRVARVSAAMAEDQLSRAQPERSGIEAALESFSFGANQFGRSHPPFSPKTAPRSCKR